MFKATSKTAGFFLVLAFGICFITNNAYGQTTSTPADDSPTAITTQKTVEVVSESPTTTPKIYEPTNPTTSTTSTIQEDILETIADDEAIELLANAGNDTTTTYYTNHVVVNYLQEEIFNDDVITTSTYFVDANNNEYSSSTISALGVLANASRQGNFPIEIQNYGWGHYLSSVAGYTPVGFDGWIYNINQADPGWIGINDYKIADEDVLTVFYSVWPWKITSDVVSTTINESITFTAYQYSSSTWVTSPSTSISINDQIFTTDVNGQYLYSTSTTGTISAFIYGDENYPQNSSAVTIEINEVLSANDSNNSGSSKLEEDPTENNDLDNTVNQITIQSTANKILEYLKSQQKESGEISDGNTTDWAIMSFGANNQYAQDIKQPGGKSLLDYEKTYSLDAGSDLNPCANYPRHIMSLLSAGVSKADSAITDLKSHMYNECYTNNLYGLDGINDDVFGLIALLALDVSPTENIVIDQVAEIKKWQIDSGAFGWPDWYNPGEKVAGDDITGAVINAFNYANSKGSNIDSEIITNAKSYLKTSQQTDGGWGDGQSDIMTTSWVLMGLNSLGETQQDWTNAQGNNPINPLINSLKNEGYYESTWTPSAVDWFAMKYAVPALLGKSWPIVLNPIVDDFSQGANYNYGSGGSSSIPEDNSEIPNTPTTTPSSTLDINDITITTSTSIKALNFNTSTIVSSTSTNINHKSPSVSMTNGQVKSQSVIKPDISPTIYEQEVIALTQPQKIKDNMSEQILSSNNNGNQINEQVDEQIIDSLPLNTPTRNTAKKALKISGGGALIIGLYLGFKLLKNLV